jgi:ubiquinone/menaquinone biosynthesis C-methylase UbiE
MIPDETEREQNPESILLDAGLRSCLTFVDVGCGDGFFALPAAKIIGDTGRIYAFDEDPEAIDRLKRKAKIEGIRNLEAKIGRAEDTILCEECADIVFFGIVLHDFEDPVKVLENSKVMLKATGLEEDSNGGWSPAANKVQRGRSSSPNRVSGPQDRER